MKSSRIRLVVFLGAISIIFVVAFQVYWVYNNFDVKEKQFNQRVSIALINVADQIAEFNGSQTSDLSPVIQMTSSYFVVDVNESIDPVVLEHFLKREFDNSHINIDFEYAIYDCETDRMVYGKYIGYEEGKAGEASELKFRKIEELAYYFGVFFPTKPTYLLQSMNLWIVSSLIILAALGFFIYAIFIILRQKRLSEVQKDFINNMTHEFKTPISSIAISAGVLLEDDIIEDPKRLKTYADIIVDQNMKLEEHIERVLLSAKSERKGLDLQLEELDLLSLIKEVVNSYERKLKSPQALHINCSEAEIIIKADRAHLTNLLYNLVDNAVKFSGAEAEVIISCVEDGTEIKLIVLDNGPGIHQKYQKKIFKRFFRIPEKEISSIPGFGLGLNYVKYVSHAHGWKIEIESSPGMGSKFIVIIKK